jgi:hypothetical protein
MMGWQPIDTAPRHAHILVAVACHGHYQRQGQIRGYLLFVASWACGHDGEGFWLTDAGRKEPAFWMPLPTPPEGDDAA